ncbi:hypothetical protein ZWY2020_014089 [Hordeum vulgare]|nr:hypothetical protein ZWY2020_014089 [Hordeum vulgare]
MPTQRALDLTRAAMPAPPPPARAFSAAAPSAKTTVQLAHLAHLRPPSAAVLHRHPARAALAAPPPPGASPSSSPPADPQLAVLAFRHALFRATPPA